MEICFYHVLNYALMGRRRARVGRPFDGLRNWQPIKSKAIEYGLDRTLVGVSWIPLSDPVIIQRIPEFSPTGEISHFLHQILQLPQSPLSILKVIQLAYNLGQYFGSVDVQHSLLEKRARNLRTWISPRDIKVLDTLIPEEFVAFLSALHSAN